MSRETLTPLDVLARFLRGRVDRELYEEALTRDCPYCGAAAGWLCVTTSDRPTTDPHAKRVTSEARIAAEQRRVAEAEAERQEAVRARQEWERRKRKEKEEWERRKREALNVPCPAPKCRAVIGTQCEQRRLGSSWFHPHQSRMGRAVAVRNLGWDALLAVPCGCCRAEPGSVCVTPKGVERPNPHAERVEAARAGVRVDPRPDATVLVFRAVVES